MLFRMFYIKIGKKISKLKYCKGKGQCSTTRRCIMFYGFLQAIKMVFQIMPTTVSLYEHLLL